MYYPEMRKDCPMRGNLGNCSPVGGFCMDAVSDEICEAVHNAYYHGFHNAVRTLKEQEADKWISVSESMPEEHETMFAQFKGTDKWRHAMFERMSEDVRVVIAFADGTRRVSHSYTVDGRWECEKSPIKRTVTHWMPNPKLPEERR